MAWLYTLLTKNHKRLKSAESLTQYELPLLYETRDTYCYSHMARPKGH